MSETMLMTDVARGNDCRVGMSAKCKNLSDVTDGKSIIQLFL